MYIALTKDSIEIARKGINKKQSSIITDSFCEFDFGFNVTLNSSSVDLII